jgi:hypothetical protein
MSVTSGLAGYTLGLNVSSHFSASLDDVPRRIDSA